MGDASSLKSCTPALSAQHTRERHRVHGEKPLAPQRAIYEPDAPLQGIHCASHGDLPDFSP
ncbi:hypothetical protein CQZ98_05295 [Pseudomonas sp. MYb115]|nr:hypothetical protein CQZ98_05295 [Pseudomonas sp. MYb115]